MQRRRASRRRDRAIAVCAEVVTAVFTQRGQGGAQRRCLSTHGNDLTTGEGNPGRDGPLIAVQPGSDICHAGVQHGPKEAFPAGQVRVGFGGMARLGLLALGQ